MFSRFLEPDQETLYVAKQKNGAQKAGCLIGEAWVEVRRSPFKFPFQFQSIPLPCALLSKFPAIDRRVRRN